MNKVVYVKAHFKPVGTEKVVKIPTGDKAIGFLGKEKDVLRSEKQFVQTGISKSQIDGERLRDDIDKAVSELNADKYEVISITPITSGEFDFKYEGSSISSSKRAFSETEAVRGKGGYGYGYGYSYTEGAIIIARKVS